VPIHKGVAENIVVAAPCKSTDGSIDLSVDRLIEYIFYFIHNVTDNYYIASIVNNLQ